MVDIVDMFGRYVDEWSEKNPEWARKLLKTGWEFEKMRRRFVPSRELLQVQQEEGALLVQELIKPLEHPDQSAIVSIFTPCEMLQETGIYPYSVEAFSSALSGSRAERPFMECAEANGIAETLCSYHKGFIGAAQMNLLPKPKCIVYTNLACDANLVTFRYLANYWQVPVFAIDVPFTPNEENVQYVADQLRQLKDFLKETTGKKIDEDSLRERVKRSRRTLVNYNQFQKERADRYIPEDSVTPLYEGVLLNIMLGTKEVEKCSEGLLKAVKDAPPTKEKKLYWMHTIPFWSQPVHEMLDLSDTAQIVCCELAQPCLLRNIDEDCTDPYVSMAQRMVYQSMNGPLSRRIEAGIHHAQETGVDGAVWFSHWGCKHTLTGAQLAKKKFEEAGIPLLVLDGDGCDRSHGGEGQTATRLGAFLEMLCADELLQKEDKAE